MAAVKRKPTPSEAARSVIDRLKDPVERPKIVNRTDTDHLNKLKTKVVFDKRKDRLWRRILTTHNANQNNSNKVSLQASKEYRLIIYIIILVLIKGCLMCA